MADPNDPVAQLDAQREATEKASEATSFFGELISKTKDRLGSLSVSFSDIQRTMDRNQQLTMAQSSAFGMLATQVVGVSHAFDSLRNIDTSGLNTAQMNVEKLVNTFKESTIASGIEDLKKRGLAGGALEEATRKVMEGAERAAEVVHKQILLYAQSVSNMEKLQNAMVQLGAQSGDLNSLWQAMDSGHLNDAVNQQANAIQLAGEATHKTKETMASYYSILGVVPQALNTLVSGTDGAEKSTSMLVATTQLATGTGRSYSQVVDDIKAAYDNYNLTGDKALQFTARISELSGRYGIELSNVRDVIVGTSNAFRMFGDESEGAAHILNNYIGVLKETGISGTTALNIIGQMTKGIEGMSIQQKSFLSLQTGGPGGLLGGFQIEQELREGKLDQVLEKVRETIKKNLGGAKFLGLEDVKTEGDAAQFQKQVMMLQQGPLGKFAQNPESAYRILEGFRNKEEGRGTMGDLSSNIVQETMKRGQDLNAQSNTVLNDMNLKIESIRNSAAQINQFLYQSAFTEQTGFQTVDQSSQNELRERLRNESANKEKAAGSVLAAGPTEDRSGETALTSFKDFMNTLGSFGPAFSSAKEAMFSAFKVGDNNRAQEEFEKTLKSFDQQMNEASKSHSQSQMERITKEKSEFEANFKMVQDKMLATNQSQFPLEEKKNASFTQAFTEAKFPEIQLRDIGVNRALKEQDHTRNTRQQTNFPGPNINEASVRPIRVEIHFSGEVGAKEGEVRKVAQDVVDEIMSKSFQFANSPGSKLSP